MIKCDHWLFHVAICTHDHLCAASYHSYPRKETFGAWILTALPTGQVSPSHVARSCSAVPVTPLGLAHNIKSSTLPHFRRQRRKTSLSSFITIYYITRHILIHSWQGGVYWRKRNPANELQNFSPPLDVCEIPPWRQPGNSVETTSSHHFSSTSLRMLEMPMFYFIRPCWWLSHIFQSVGNRGQPFAHQISSNFHL